MERLVIMLFFGVLALSAPLPATGREVHRMVQLQISSPAFDHRQAIPARFTCDARDVNPPLRIDNVPAGAKSLLLIVDDPDAPGGMWVHWVVWNIPPETREIGENSLPAGAVQGLNGWKKNRYGGPCPPAGTHRYFFKFYALDTTLNLAPATAKAGLERAMQGHVLARGELMGTYHRKR